MPKNKRWIIAPDGSYVEAAEEPTQPQVLSELGKIYDLINQDKGRLKIPGQRQCPVPNCGMWVWVGKGTDDEQLRAMAEHVVERHKDWIDEQWAKRNK